MKLNQLRDDKNKRQSRKRVGRGIGCGKGKTCGRGGKGQTARSGVAIDGFEGGQTPIYRRLPKVGFKNIFKTKYQVINTGDLQRFVDSKKIDKSKDITADSLYEAGILSKNNLPLKVLAKGSVKDAIKIVADAASKTAIAAIEKAGGKVSIG